MKNNTIPGVWLAVVVLLFTADAKMFYVDPVFGKTENDGGRVSPWKTLQEVIDNNRIQTRAFANNPYRPGDTLKIKNAGAPVAAGDTLVLKTGYHGDIAIQGALNTEYITIVAAAGQIPRVNHILLSGAAKWRIQGLSVSAAFDTVGHNRDLLFVDAEGWAGPSRDIIVENCSLSSVDDASFWTLNNWATRACTGARIHGRKVVFQNNIVSNVDFGIRVVADSCRIEKNVFENFTSTGIRLCGSSNCEFRNNVVRGFHKVTSEYGMGFQAYSTDPAGTGAVAHIKVVGNTIINTAPGQPFQGQMYGIACFSGIYDDWTVENNIIMTNTWYGIAFNDVRNCRIINNTVCRYDTANEALPAIVISGGMKNFPCVVRNNLCAVISIEGDSTCQNDHNLFIGDPEEYFLDYRNRDLRLKPRCAAIDNGSPELAPADDISGVARPRGMGVDVGAYEYVAPLAIRAADIARVGFNKPALTNRNVFRVCDLRGRATIQRGSASGVYVVSAKNGKSRISSAAIIRQLN